MHLVSTRCHAHGVWALEEACPATIPVYNHQTTFYYYYAQWIVGDLFYVHYGHYTWCSIGNEYKKDANSMAYNIMNYMAHIIIVRVLDSNTLE